MKKKTDSKQDFGKKPETLLTAAPYLQTTQKYFFAQMQICKKNPKNDSLFEAFFLYFRVFQKLDRNTPASISRIAKGWNVEEGA